MRSAQRIQAVLQEEGKRGHQHQREQTLGMMPVDDFVDDSFRHHRWNHDHQRAGNGASQHRRCRAPDNVLNKQRPAKPFSSLTRNSHFHSLPASATTSWICCPRNTRNRPKEFLKSLRVFRVFRGQVVSNLLRLLAVFWCVFLLKRDRHHACGGS